MIKNAEPVRYVYFGETKTENAFVCKWMSDFYDVCDIARTIENKEEFSNQDYVNLYNLRNEMKVLADKTFSFEFLDDVIKEPVCNTQEIIDYYIDKMVSTKFDPYNEKKGKSADLSFMLHFYSDLNTYL